jgi:histone H3/H4
MSEFSISAMHNLVKSQGDKRVSNGSADQLRSILETFAGDVAEEAIAIAKEEGYQTVKGEHVRKALKS